jgi:hypothetical protein
MNYKVTFECRERNAQGCFWPQIVFVSAENKETANREAMNKLHKEGFETRFPISTEEGEVSGIYENFVVNGLVDMQKLKEHKRRIQSEFIAKRKNALRR